MVISVAALWLAAPVVADGPVEFGAPAHPAIHPVETIVTVDDAPAGGGTAWTLDRLEQTALRAHPVLSEAAAAVEAARGRAVQAGLYPNPTALGGTNQIGGQQTQWVATVRQEIVTKDKLGLDRAAVQREVEQAELDWTRRRFEVLTRVRQKFFEVLAMQERVATLELLDSILKKSEEASIRRQQGGEASRADVLLIEVESKRVQVRLENARTRLAAAKRELATIAGDPQLTIESITGDLGVRLDREMLGMDRLDALDENARARHAEVEIARRQILLRRAQVENCPNVALESGYQNSVAEPNNQAILMLEAPLPVWNRNQGNIRSARAEIGRSIERLRATQLDLTEQAIAARTEYEQATELVEQFEESILPASREVVELSQRGFEGGEFNVLNLITAQRNLVEVNLEYIDARSRRLSAAAAYAGLVQLESFPAGR